MQIFNAFHFKYYFKFIILKLVFLLVACEGGASGVSKNIKQRDNYLKVINNASRYINQEVVLGGLIVGVKNEETLTTIEIVNLPLDENAIPIKDASSQGRFIVRYNGFIEPSILKNSYIRVSGIVLGKQKGRIDDMLYDYLLLKTDSYQTWRESELNYQTMRKNIYRYTQSDVFIEESPILIKRAPFFIDEINEPIFIDNEFIFIDGYYYH